MSPGVVTFLAAIALMSLVELNLERVQGVMQLIGMIVLGLGIVSLTCLPFICLENVPLQRPNQTAKLFGWHESRLILITIGFQQCEATTRAMVKELRT